MITKNTECDSPEPQSVFSLYPKFGFSPHGLRMRIGGTRLLVLFVQLAKKKSRRGQRMKRLENNNKKMIANKPANQQPKLGQEWKNEWKEMGEQRDAIRPPSESTPITARPCFSTCWGGMGGTTTVRTLTRGSILREMSSIQCSVFEPTHPK